jgi:hypothetical protein
MDTAPSRRMAPSAGSVMESGRARTSAAISSAVPPVPSSRMIGHRRRTASSTCSRVNAPPPATTVTIPRPRARVAATPSSVSRSSPQLLAQAQDDVRVIRIERHPSGPGRTVGLHERGGGDADERRPVAELGDRFAHHLHDARPGGPVDDGGPHLRGRTGHAAREEPAQPQSDDVRERLGSAEDDRPRPVESERSEQIGGPIGHRLAHHARRAPLAHGRAPGRFRRTASGLVESGPM